LRGSLRLLLDYLNLLPVADVDYYALALGFVEIFNHLDVGPSCGVNLFLSGL